MKYKFPQVFMLLMGILLPIFSYGASLSDAPGVWSANCNDPNLEASIYYGPDGQYREIQFKNGQVSSVWKSSGIGFGPNMYTWSGAVVSPSGSAAGNFEITYSFFDGDDGGVYKKIIYFAINGSEIIKKGKRISDNEVAQPLKKCPTSSIIYGVAARLQAQQSKKDDIEERNQIKIAEAQEKQKKLAAMNSPGLLKNWKLGIEYIWSPGECSQKGNEVCLSDDEYNAACEAAGKNPAGLSDHLFDQMFLDWTTGGVNIFKSGTITEASISKRGMLCWAHLAAKGIIRGNSASDVNNVVVNRFVLNSSKKVAAYGRQF